jgi:hypothetical protein
MATGKAKGGKKLTQLSRKRRKSPAASRPPSPRSKVRAPRPRDYRKESGAALSEAIKRAPLRKLSQLRRESGAAVSVAELRDFLRRKPKGR